MKKLFTKSVSVFLAMLLVMTSLSFSAFALDTDAEKEQAAEYEALGNIMDIDLSYKVDNYELQAQTGNFFSTKMNIGKLLIHKVPLPKIPAGKQIDKFLIRTGTGSNTTEILRIDYADWDFSTLPQNLGADSEQLKPITQKDTYKNYSIVEGEAVRLSGGSGSYQKLYRDISSYAKECVANGQEYFYVAVGCFASTHSMAQGCMTDSTYTRLGLDPKVIYSFKDAPELELVSSSVEDGAEDVAADGEVSFEFSNEISSAKVTVNGEDAECSVGGSTVFVEASFAECSDFDINVSARDIYGQTSDASIRFSTGLKSGAIVPENPSIGTYNVKCVVSDDNTELNELSFKLLTEFDDINEAIEVREIGKDKIDAEFALDEETLRYNITSPIALEEGTAYEAVIKAGVEDKYGEAAEADVVITKFLAGETSTEEFADNSDCDFTVELDKENSSLDVWFMNPAYSNREIELSVSKDDEVITSKTITTGARGIATLDEVILSESGEYTVRVCPKNSPECFGMVYDFYTPEDILGFWNLIANGGTAADVLNAWETLCELFGLENEYLAEVSDFDALSQKIVALRGNGLGEMTADNEYALNELVTLASFFTAFEECKDPETVKGYIDTHFEELQSANSDVCARWTERMTSDYADKIVSELSSADKTINAYADITTAMDVPLTKYSVENIKAQEYEALGDVVDIPDGYALGGGKISNDSSNFTGTKINNGSMVIYKIALPTLPEGKTIDKFILRTGSSSGSLVVLKMTHVMPELSNLPMDAPESFASVYGEDTYKQHNIVEDKIITVKGYTNQYKINYIDISSYAKECIADGYKHMYVGVGCYASSLNVANACMTDTDYTKAGLDPKYIASFGEPGANGFVSSTVENNSEDVAADTKVSFKFVNRIDQATATLNGENAEVSMKGRDVTLETALSECTDYELTIAATDMFGQKVSKTIRFSTGFKEGSIEAETPVIDVYDVKYSVDTVTNELLELSFSLLTQFADINQAIEIREVGADAVVSEFVFYDAIKKYDLASPVALNPGKTYEAVIKKGASDIYGNAASEDAIIAKFYAGETPDTKITDDAELEATFDAENATLSVYFKNSAYSNNEITVTIENAAGTAYEETVTSGKRGVVAIDGIKLPESGDYVLKISPKSAPGVYKKDTSFYTESDISKYWNMVAVNGNASYIASNWEKIEFIFGLSNEYSDDISDVGSLASKIVSQRDGFGEMTAESVETLQALVLKLSWFTAVEQSETPDKAIALIAPELDVLKGYDKDVCDEWTVALESEFASDLKEALESIENSVDSYEDVIAIMDKALDAYRIKNILKTVANAFHMTEVKEIVTNEKYAKLLGIEEFMDDYNDLKSTSFVDKAMMKKFDNAKDFADAFEEAVKDAKKAEKDKDKDSGSTGGGGGAPSGNGGSTGFQVVSTAPVEDTPFNPFADIENIAWAKEHIIKLYNKGIINGKSSSSFAPYDNITREEFVKLIVSLTSLTDDGSAQGFSDVPENSWFAQYVKAAVANGVVKGIGANSFGTGLNATRQDIAVMIVNALVKKGVVVSDEVSSFADNGEISDYAKSAVAFLNAKGVITGDANKYFNPKAHATRAEVAVMLSRVSDIFSKEVK